jgi:hypothetical protein
VFRIRSSEEKGIKLFEKIKIFPRCGRELKLSFEGGAFPGYTYFTMPLKNMRDAPSF